jgi:hypothetical protein
MTIADVTELNILKLVFNATTWANYAINASASPETNIVVALHTADPGDAGTQSTSEAAYGSYARVNVARTTGGWTASGTAPAQVVPVAAITFPASSGSGSTITHFSTGKSGGGATDILWSGTVTPNIAVGASGITPQLTTATSITLD